MIPRHLLLGLPLLLAACSAPSAPPPPVPPGPPDDDMPTVQRPVREGQPTCTLPAAVQGIGGLARLQGVNLVPALRPQATPSLYDLLLGTRAAINLNYWGHSDVDLQALHERYEAAFRTTFGNLRLAALSAQTDALMNEYVDGVQDGHTYYLDPAAYRLHTAQSSGAPTEVPRFGFSWAPIPGEDGALILDAARDTPAYEAGLRRGDTVLRVNGTALVRSGDDAASRAAMQAILSAATRAGEPAELLVRRAGQTLTVALTPRLIGSAPRPYGTPLGGGVYLLRLPSFAAPGTAQDVHDLVREAQQGGAETLILDLRDNGGGLLVEAVAAGGAFSPATSGQTVEFLTGPSVTFAYRGGAVQAGEDCALDEPLLTLERPAHWTGRTLILLSAASASASEILAHYLRPVGARTFGEVTAGVADTTTFVYALPGARGVAVTAGLSRDLAGQYLPAAVTPDTPVPDDLRALAHGTDTALQEALSSLK